MERNEILAKLNVIFCDVFDNEEIVITPDTVAEDIDEWDSLGHIQLIKELENVFNIKFSSKEIMSWDSVAEMIDSIQSKL